MAATSDTKVPVGHPNPVVASELVKDGETLVPSVPALISLQAIATPETLAISGPTGQLNYAELERKSNQLANYLRSSGVGANQIVAILLERSPESIMAALAVMKSGAAYLPIQPGAPAGRVAFMLRDAAVAMVLTRSSLVRELLGGPWRLIELDRDAAIAVESERLQENEVLPQDLAYVIYTSGSTGEPKGVEVMHRGLSNLVQWHCRAFSLQPQDRASHVAALGFDAAVWEVWPYLTVGASIHIPSERVRQNPECLHNWFIDTKITIGFVPTPIAENMLLLDWPARASLRILLTGADTLHRRPQADLPFQLVNNYGPTECTVVATSGVVTPGNGTLKTPSIGRPIDNTQIHILDDQMRPVPVGSAGEIYIGGAGVARGYRNQPDLTRSKFVPDLFSGKDEARLYRTGDIGRQLPDGEIEFLGRIDEQVKIRGYRVEPNEIVNALDRHPAIQSSVVVGRSHGNGEATLVAYVVLSHGSEVKAGDLVRHLRTRLPDYMIPSAFVNLSVLPLVPNGKVDRNALPSPANAELIPDDEFEAPTTLIEQRLAPIIAPLLRVERVGRDDNFFLLGGHSLLGTQLITRIRQVFGVELTLLSLFDHPTLSGMAFEIEKLIFEKLSVSSQAAD